MSLAELVILSVKVEGRSKSEVARRVELPGQLQILLERRHPPQGDRSEQDVVLTTSDSPVADRRFAVSVLLGLPFQRGQHPGLVVDRLLCGDEPVCDVVVAEDRQASRQVRGSPRPQHEPRGSQWGLVRRHDVLSSSVKERLLTRATTFVTHCFQTTAWSRCDGAPTTAADLDGHGASPRQRRAGLGVSGQPDLRPPRQGARRRGLCDGDECLEQPAPAVALTNPPRPRLTPGRRCAGPVPPISPLQRGLD
jgi:hypothetical protein